MYQSIAAFTLAAALLTVTPGLDTALVLRTATSEGRRPAALAALGITLGLLVWGVCVGLGLGLLLLGSALVLDALRWVGAAYLLYLGLLMLRSRKAQLEPSSAADSGHARSGWLVRGVLSNLLNPKVGLFYVSFLPQFIPHGVSAGPFSVLLACIHAVLGLLWFAVLIAITAPIASALRRPGVVRWLDRATGAVFIAFGLRLAFGARR